MTLPSYPSSLSLSQIEQEFTCNGSYCSLCNPKSLSEFYASAYGRVVSGTIGYPNGVATPIPSSGALSINNFHGAKAACMLVLNSTQSWTVPAGASCITVLLAGGGGGGGSTVGHGGDGGGGGGAGGIVATTLSVNPGDTYCVVVGAGGAGGSATTLGDWGSNGGYTCFCGPGGSWLAGGGGGGGGSHYGGYGYNYSGRNGASGGGASSYFGNTYNWTPGAATYGIQGNRGGCQCDNGTNGSGGAVCTPGGDYGQGTGGQGLSFYSVSATGCYCVAGGGGAGGGFTDNPSGFTPSSIFGQGKPGGQGYGAAGGDGAAATGGNALPGADAVVNRGGGGGGGGGHFYDTNDGAGGGQGGSGVVVIALGRP